MRLNWLLELIVWFIGGFFGFRFCFIIVLKKKEEEEENTDWQ